MLTATGVHDAGGPISRNRTGDGVYTWPRKTLLPALRSLDEVGDDPPGAEQCQRDTELKWRACGKRDQCADSRHHGENQCAGVEQGYARLSCLRRNTELKVTPGHLVSSSVDGSALAGAETPNRDLDVSLSRHFERGPYGIYGMALGPHQEAKGPTRATLARFPVVVLATAVVRRHCLNDWAAQRFACVLSSGESTTPASPSGEAGVVLTACLQRNPDSEEPEAPLIESGVPHGSLLVAPVVDRAISPVPAGRRERPVPIGPRRLAGAPWRGSVTPRRTAEVATLGISVPWAAGMIGSTRTTGPARRSAWVTGTARAAGATWTAGSARITGCVRRMDSSRSRPAMIACRTRRWPSRSGVGRTGAHTQRGSAQSAGDGYPSK